MSSMLDILEDFMVLRAIPFARLDGKTRRPRRSLDIKLVNIFISSIIVKFNILALYSSSKKSLVRLPSLGFDQHSLTEIVSLPSVSDLYESRRPWCACLLWYHHLFIDVHCHRHQSD